MPVPPTRRRRAALAAQHIRNAQAAHTRRTLQALVHELMSMDLVHKLCAGGSVLVLRAHVELLLGDQVPTKAIEPHFEPNWVATLSPERPAAKRKQ
jgi:hypothetical protein